MPFIKLTSRSTKERILLSGVPNSGKTTSLQTFIYGQYDPLSTNEVIAEAAQRTAGDKQMAILSCPGEKGVRSLIVTDHITPYIYETTETEEVSARWSKEAVDTFQAMTDDIIDSKPDVLAIDGIHSLYEQKLNQVTGGAYLTGVDFDPKLYGVVHGFIGQYITRLYHSVVPTIVVTTWEDWEVQSDDPARANEKGATRKLWPALPGKMAKRICGHFDARLSCRLERSCIHANCAYLIPGSKEQRKAEHHVWQFLSKGDVAGVGIKGLRVGKEEEATPYMHQNYMTLKAMMAR